MQLLKGVSFTVSSKDTPLPLFITYFIQLIGQLLFFQIITYIINRNRCCFINNCSIHFFTWLAAIRISIAPGSAS